MRSNFEIFWKSFNPFSSADQAEDAVFVLEPQASPQAVTSTKRECCIIEVENFALILESGTGCFTTPLLSIDTTLEAMANNWSSNLSASGRLSLTMNYYNQALADWEPVIERNERIKKDGERVTSPWELNFNLEIEKTVSEIEEDKEESKTSIKIHSEENLEMTVSKTFLDIVTQLGEAFSKAMDPSGLIKPDVEAGHVVINDTGFDLNLSFTRGAFTLHECHMPHGSVSGNKSLVFQSEQGKEVVPDTVQHCTISPGCKAYLQSKSVPEGPDAYEQNIYATIGSINKQLVLPVCKSDKRYFPLYRDTNQDPWGIVSEVKMEFGVTVINIHSVLNVS